MFSFARLSLGKYRRVLHQPELVNGLVITIIGKRLHLPPDRLVSCQSEMS
jgi:hypothetical protein